MTNDLVSKIALSQSTFRFRLLDKNRSDLDTGPTVCDNFLEKIKSKLHFQVTAATIRTVLSYQMSSSSKSEIKVGF